MIRLDNNSGATSQLLCDERGHVAEIHQGGNFHALMSRGKTEIVCGVVRNCKRVKIDLADTEVFARLDVFDAILQGFGALARFIIADVETLAYVSVAGLRRDIDWTIYSAQAALVIRRRDRRVHE